MMLFSAGVRTSFSWRPAQLCLLLGLALFLQGGVKVVKSRPRGSRRAHTSCFALTLLLLSWMDRVLRTFGVLQKSCHITTMHGPLSVQVQQRSEHLCVLWGPLLAAR